MHGASVLLKGSLTEASVINIYYCIVTVSLLKGLVVDGGEPN